MKFFIDNNLSPKLARGMQGFGEDVMHLKDEFQDDAKDIEWLPYIGDNNIILVTKDDRIRYHPAELNALKAHKVGAFILSGKNLNGCQLIQQLVRNWPRMKEYAKKTDRPFAFKIPPKGKKFVSIAL